MRSLILQALIAVVCGSALACLPLSLAARQLQLTPAQAADGPYYISAPDVNLREKPNGEIILVFELDDKVFVIKRDGKWAYVSAVEHDKKGWVFSKFLSKERARPEGDDGSGSAPTVVVGNECVNDDKAAPAAKTPAAPAKNGGKSASATPEGMGLPGGAGIALVGATDVNVRADASLKSSIVGKVDKGDKLYVMKIEDPWYYVSIPTKSLKGWVFGEYVNMLPRLEIKGNDVRLREKPSLQGRIKTEVDKGDVFFKFEEKDGWVLLASSASGLKGWVKAEWVKKTEKAASRPYKVTADQVNFRTSPNVDADIITTLPEAADVKVLGRNDKWSYVEHGGKQGWVYSAYLDPNFKHAPKEVYGKSIGDRLIKRAMALKGTPYVWGGESEDGVDCSGLVYKVLLDEGADASNLPRRASTQMAGLGQEVDKEDLEPGDLVFFNTYKPVGHVGIYIGDGNFIHASSAKHQVAIGNLSEGYYKQRFCGARRITEEELKRLQ